MNHQAEFVADLHIHSRYAYACSKNLTLANISETARIKGIDLLATGDFTHPAWLSELEENLVPTDEGVYQYNGVAFIFGTEVSCIFKQAGRSRRVHVLLFLSSLESVKRFNAALSERGAKLEGDGRPSVSLSAADLTSLALEIDAGAMVLPAHIWTPWYGMLGSVSGFDSLEECFGDMAPAVRAVETGLSSDPAMNWGVDELASRALVSFSDAHSLPSLGRESTVFRGLPTYAGLKAALENRGIAYTVEFHPEEGKYHYNGHRKCGVVQSPEETLAQGNESCPACGRALTLGVLHRVKSLSLVDLGDRGSRTGALPQPPDGRPPFVRLVPLEELLGMALGFGRRSKAVARVYQSLCNELGSELEVLRVADEADLRQIAGERVARAIVMARYGEVTVDPGFDGQYGTVRIGGQRADA